MKLHVTAFLSSMTKRKGRILIYHIHSYNVNCSEMYSLHLTYPGGEMGSQCMVQGDHLQI